MQFLANMKHEIFELIEEMLPNESSEFADCCNVSFKEMLTLTTCQATLRGRSRIKINFIQDHHKTIQKILFRIFQASIDGENILPTFPLFFHLLSAFFFTLPRAATSSVKFRKIKFLLNYSVFVFVYCSKRGTSNFQPPISFSKQISAHFMQWNTLFRLKNAIKTKFMAAEFAKINEIKFNLSWVEGRNFNCF